MVIAGTGSGKLINVLGPNILIHEGPQYIVDPKGELASVTARHRGKLGPVFILDPFGMLGLPSACLNPFDLIGLPGMQVEDCADTLAWELAAGHESSRDPFWQYSATALVAGLIANAYNDPDPTRRNLCSVIEDLGCDDIVYSLAVKLDANKIHGEFAQRRIKQFLQIPDGSSAGTRGCVATSAQQYLHCFSSQRIMRCIKHSSLELRDVLGGEKCLTVYFVFPPTKSKSHRGLLRIWLSTILSTLIHRSVMPKAQTLVVIDEAANLGCLDQLPTMYSFLRGTGTSVLTAWQSMGQLNDIYQAQSRTICENCDLIQAFGLHSTAVDAVAGLIGIPPRILRSLGEDEQIVAINGREPQIGTKVDYRQHAELRCRADANPRYERRSNTI